MIRPASSADTAALVGLENRCFEIDRLSERSFRHLLTRGKAAFFVYEEQQQLLGYALVLFHQNTSMARLYSLAVLPECRGRGVAAALMQASEAGALQRGVVSMRLEVHVDNSSAIALYRKLGYQEFAVFPDYYEDHAAALRMQKPLAPHLAADRSRVPFYAQTLEFTCGPACLMMAMKALKPEIKLSRKLELRLWREATSIFMTSGHGGCSPFGLALSVYQRGLTPELYVPCAPEMFVDSVRNEEKREVIRIVQGDFLQQIRQLKLPLHEQHLTLDALEKRFQQGAIPVLLISAYRLTGDKSPHWVVVSGIDEYFIYIHEPYVDSDNGQSETTCFGIPVARHEFERMRYYGSRRQYATLLLTRGEH